MDPVANISEQREIAVRILWGAPPPAGGSRDDSDLADAERLAELVLALDAWMASGGFSPYSGAKG